jgi:beta-lactamase class A
VALADKASDDGKPEVHLGANFPLTLTAQTASVDGDLWYEANWQTPSLHGTGWLPASAVTITQPTGGAVASFDALDVNLASYLAGYGTRVGVDVLDVTRGTSYAYNADLSFYVASSMKVPIMLTFLTQLEAKGREPNDYELSLLTTMIENSNNDSATKLWTDIGYQRGIRAFMRGVGISGLSPATPVVGWGYSTIRPSTMVALLDRLHEGTVLNKADRKLAIYLMEHIQADQRVGVGDSSPSGATVAMKDGWTSIKGPSGPYFMNSSGIVTLGDETYIIAIYTDSDQSYGEGYKITRNVARIVGERLMGSS